MKLSLRQAFAGAALLLASPFLAAQTATITDVADLNSFTGGNYLQSTMMQASDGNYYGTTADGGTGQAGIIFELMPGSPFTATVLHNFDQSAEGGSAGALIEGSDGNLYGMTGSGGPNGNGVFFRVNLNSKAFTVVHAFGSESYDPSSMTLGSDGNFYVATAFGGAGSNGSLLQISLGGAVNTVATFNSSTGETPMGGVVETSPGTFYGTAAGGTSRKGVIYQAVVANGTATVTDVFNFGGTNGYGPSGTMVAGPNGLLYGVTDEGGASQFGNVFDFNISTKAETSLYDMGTNPSVTGEYPLPLALASDGNFYFPTQVSSQEDCAASLNQITPSGTLTTVYNGNTTDARNANILSCPLAGVIQGSDGSLYGTGNQGGIASLGDIYAASFTPPLAPPIQLAASTSTPSAGSPFTISYTVANAFSVSAQQCYAFVQGGSSAAGAWTGKLTGTTSSSGWKGSASVTPTTAGTYTYAMTCAGTESGFLTVKVGSGQTKATASVTVAENPSTATYGQKETLTISVQSATNSGPAPTGTVTVTTGSTTLGTATLTAGTGTTSTASITFTANQLKGNLPLSITYSGDNNYNKASAGASLTIVGIATVTKVYGPSYVHSGDTAQLYFEVVGSPDPAGTITINVAGIAIGPITLQPSVSYAGASSATFSAPTTGVPVGAYSVTATYTPANGTAFNASTSSPITLNITSAPDPVAGQLTITPNPVPYGTSIELTPETQTTTNPCTGTFSFYFGSDFLFTLPTASANVVCYYAHAPYVLGVAGVPPGTYTLTTVYNGSSKAAAQTYQTQFTISAVNAYATPNPVAATAGVTFHAQVAPSANGQAAKGSITFAYDLEPFGIVPFAQNVPLDSSGKATFGPVVPKQQDVPAGTYTIIAYYYPQGSSSSTASISFPLTVTAAQ